MSDLPSHLSAREREEALRFLDRYSRGRGTSRSYPFAFLFIIFTLFLTLGACSKKKVEVKNLAVNPDSLYTARMVALNTLISDSGLIRYRMTAPELLIYERSERNEWVFPRGLVLRPYDLKSGSQVFIKADSAIRRPLKEEWELIGHVHVQGPAGQRLKAQRRADQRLYSDDTTYFVTNGKELRGSHFNAKDDLSWYEIYDNKGSFDYDENKSSAQPVSATSRTDSLKQAPRK